MDRIIKSCFVLFLALALFCGCAAPSANTNTADTAGSAGASSDAEPVAEGERYVIVLPKNASMEMKTVVRDLQTAIKKKTGEKPDIVNDDSAPQLKEIRVGSVNRPGAAELIAQLNNDADFSVVAEGETLFLAGRSEYALRGAVDFARAAVADAVGGWFPVGISYHDAEHRHLTAPLARYSFDEGDGAKALDAVSGKAAELINASWVDGISGSGVFLDDSSSAAVSLGTGYINGLLNGKGVVTFNLWIMPYQNRNSRLFSFYGDGQTLSFYSLFKPAQAYFYTRSEPSESLIRDSYKYVADKNSPISGKGDNVDNSGVWQMLTMIADFEKNELAFYVNGSRVSGVNNTAADYESNVFSAGSPTLPDVLGGDPAEKAFGFCGIMDEFSVYDSRLTDDEISYLYNSYTDTNSPVADEALAREVVSVLRSDAALAEGKTVYCSEGKQVPLDPDNYSASVTVRDGKWIVPAAFGISYFGADAVEKSTPTDGGYDLQQLCDAAGRRLWISPDQPLAVVSANMNWSKVSSVVKNRLYRFLSECSFKLPVVNTEQSRVVVAQSGKDITHCFSPFITLIDGEMYVTMDNHARTTYVYKSTDGGKSFTNLSTVRYLSGASLFEQGGRLYLLGMGTSGNSQICITQSTDKGKTWSDLTVVPYDVNYKYCCPGAVVKANGRIYKAYEGYKDTSWKEDKRAYVVSAPQNADLLDPASWTVSSYYSYGTKDLHAALGSSFYTDKTYIEEGSIVLTPEGKLIDVIRIDSYPLYGHAVTMTVSADGKTLRYDKNSDLALIDIPTGADLFHIEYDAKSGYYISLVNVKTTSYRPFQRNVLALAVSRDLKKWTAVTNLLVDRTMMNEYVSMCMHGFQYVSFAFDGNDLVYAVRESADKAENYHDNNYLTFYRLSNFRSLLP